MTLDEIGFSFNRAFWKTFNPAKLALTFFVLLLCGVLAVFFRGIAFESGQWLAMSFIFLPLFICAGILLSLGVLLIRLYHDEVKQKSVDVKETVVKSWQVIIGASYFSIPVILSFLLLWMLLGIFLLLSQIPVLGTVLSLLLSFVPFIISFGTLCLAVLILATLFYVTPILALKSHNQMQVSRILTDRFKENLFGHIFLGLVGIMPLTVIVLLLVLASLLTGLFCSTCDTALQTVMIWLFTMAPFSAFLAPAIVFFFNFAAETHVLCANAAKAK